MNGFWIPTCLGILWLYLIITSKKHQIKFESFSKCWEIWFGVLIWLWLTSPEGLPSNDKAEGGGEDLGESWEAGNSEGELRMASGSKYLRERMKSPHVGCVRLFLTSILNEGGSFEKLNFYLFWGGRKVARAAWETGRWGSLLGLAQRHSPYLKGQYGTGRGKFQNVEIWSV